MWGRQARKGVPAPSPITKAATGLSAFLEAVIPATRVPLSRGVGEGGGKFKPPQDTQVTPMSDPGDPGGGPENAVSTLLRAAGISHPVKPETPVPLHLLRTGSPEAARDAGRAQDIPREGSTGACGGQGAPRGPRSSLPAWPAPPVPVIPKERVD